MKRTLGVLRNDKTRAELDALRHILADTEKELADARAEIRRAHIEIDVLRGMVDRQHRDLLEIQGYKNTVRVL